MFLDSRRARSARRGQKRETMTARLKRGIYTLLGLVFFGTGVVGAFLPVLPTTPFMLLALWAFARSSQRLHDYVWHHRRYGPLVRAWHETGAVPVRAKLAAIVDTAASGVYVGFFSGAPWWGIAAALALIGTGALYLLTRPSL
jgi:hypothetical protein